MKTNDLIDFLSIEPQVLPKSFWRLRSVALLIGGLLISSLMMKALYGVRPDLLQSMSQANFWVKLMFSISLAVPASQLLISLGRPGMHIKWLWWIMAIPFLAMGLMALQDVMHADVSQRSAMVLGETWRSCPFNITLLSLPLMGASLGFAKSLAPTKLQLTGACAGFLSGALAAMVYCFHCPESALPFVVIWYSLGILLPMGLGAYLGPKILSW